MKLTDKAKEDFDEWYELHYEAILLRSIDDSFYIDGFYELPKSMRYGIYVDWADSVGIHIEIGVDFTTYEKYCYKVNNGNWNKFLYRTRKKARKKVIKILNKKYNKKHGNENGN